MANVEVCTVHRVCKTPEGVWSRKLYEAICLVRRNGNYEIGLVEGECFLCLEFARASMLFLFATRELIHPLHKVQRYRVLPVRGG